MMREIKSLLLLLLRSLMLFPKQPPNLKELVVPDVNIGLLLLA